MSLIIKEIVKKTKEKYGSDLLETFKKLKLEIIETELAGRLKEITFKDFIILKQGLPEYEKRHYLAHALGHCILHKGNYFYIDNLYFLRKVKYETEAEKFASYYLIDEECLKKLLKDEYSLSEIAEYFNVSLFLVELRIKCLNS